MRTEFIGLDVQVDPIGVAGRVVNETKNTITVESHGQERVAPKQGNEFRFTYEGNVYTVNGSDIRFRPEDRIKRIR